MKILFLIPYPLKQAPSQRFRFEQYFNTLSEKGYIFKIQPFFDNHSWQLFYKPGNLLFKALALANGYLKRFFILFNLYQYHFIFIHREASPAGPPVIEWLIAKVFGKKIIYDFDDAIWLTDRQKESWFLRVIKWRSKVSSICKWSYKISCGNEYLSAYARQFNNNVFINVTTIDTEHLHNPALHSKKVREDKVVIGWTGSHSTLKYLKEIEKILQDIEDHYSFVEIMIVANLRPDLSVKSLVFRPWQIDTEIKDLMTFDIGVMPLPDDEWSKGKCGFKALQYMALQIPVIASPVGVNTSIIDNGKTGYLASTPEDWKNYLHELITHKSVRIITGEAARKKIINQYSVSSNTSMFLSLFASS